MKIKDNIDFNGLVDKMVSNIEINPEDFTYENIGLNLQTICPKCECERTSEVIEHGKVKCLECGTEALLDLKVNLK